MKPGSPRGAASSTADGAAAASAAAAHDLPPATGGRPSKYDPAFCDQIADYCRRGRSLKAFAGKIGVSRRTLNYWREAHAEFDEACEVALAQACAWWENRARDVAKGDGGPGAATVAVFMVKNYGAEDFSDKRELVHTGQVDHRHMTYEQALEEAQRRGLPLQVLLEASAE